MADGRTCNRCGQWKDASNFAPLKGGVNGLYPKCNECRAAICRERYATDPAFRATQIASVARWHARRRAATEPAREAARGEYERTTRAMHALYTGGMTAAEVGERYGRSETGVLRRFRRAGLATRKRHEIAKPWLTSAIADYERGASGNAIARTYGVAEGTIYRALRLAGVTIRPRPHTVRMPNGRDMVGAEPITLGYMTTAAIAWPGRGHWNIDTILAHKEEYNAALAREVAPPRYGRVAA